MQEANNRPVQVHQKRKEIISNCLDGKALKASFPDIYSQFVKETTSRRFTVAE